MMAVMNGTFTPTMLDRFLLRHQIAWKLRRDPTLRLLGFEFKPAPPDGPVKLQARSGVRAYVVARGGYIEASTVRTDSCETHLDTVGFHLYEHHDAMSRKRWNVLIATGTASIVQELLARFRSVVEAERGGDDAPRPVEFFDLLEASKRSQLRLYGPVLHKDYSDDNWYYHLVARLDYSMWTSG